ncbi:unnamed protein product [Prunus brigantina]
MGTTLVPMFLPEDGLSFKRQSGASPTLPPFTHFGNSPVIQTTVETELLAQITSLRQDMAKLQEHNNLLSSKDRYVQSLHIPFYTGVEDPLTHLHPFQSAIGCKGLSDEGQCLLFPFSFTEAALNWFYRLQPETTDRMYSANDLYTIWLRKDEPLREYVARFSHEYSRCPETNDRAAYGAFKSGLRSSHFRYLVHSSNWHTYNELIKQAAIHAKAEYFNSKSGPSARQEEPTLRSYPMQESPYAPTRRNDESSARHKRKDNHDTRQGHSKIVKGKYGRNDHREPLPNPDRA